MSSLTVQVYNPKVIKRVKNDIFMVFLITNSRSTEHVVESFKGANLVCITGNLYNPVSIKYLGKRIQ